MTRDTVVAPSGREWTIRVTSWHRPRWRQLGDPAFADDDFWPLALLYWLVFGLLLLLVVPLLLFTAAAAAAAVRAAFGRTRWVEAAHPGPPPSQLTWRTTREHAAAVAEQVARELELGYERIEPHNARFLGFSGPRAVR